MAYSEPYSSLLNGVATRLVDSGGPFTKSDQVKLWVDEALDEMMPSDALQGELSRDVPIALVCDGGNAPDSHDSGGTTEEQTVKVWFASNAPTMEAAVTGNGTEFWGYGAIKHWLSSRLGNRSWAISGWDNLLWRGTRPVAVRGTGQVLGVATFVTLRTQET